MFRDLLASEFAPYGQLSSEQLDQLEAHYQLLKTWNTVINLTRINELEDVVRLHYCESLFVASALPVGPQRILDVGSGAGFPGVPVAIVRPECRVTLVESHQRKAVFLQEASRNLSNTQVRACRAENIEGQFDWIVSRAVTPTQVRSLQVAKCFAILMGEKDVYESNQSTRVLKVPWGENRVLALFHVERFADEPC